MPTHRGAVVAAVRSAIEPTVLPTIGAAHAATDIPTHRGAVVAAVRPAIEPTVVPAVDATDDATDDSAVSTAHR